MTRSEHMLWRRWVNRRDAQAFDELVRRHSAFVYDFARRVAGNASDAEDLTQEAYLELADAESGVPERVGLRPFLGRRIVLGARMLRRASLSRQRRDARGTPPSPSRGPEDHDRREQAEAALSLLPDDERHAVELRFLHELSYAEIAHVLGVTEEAARMRVHRSLKRLRVRLGGDPAMLLGALPLFHPPAALLASTAKTALLTGGVVAMNKKLMLVVVLLLLIAGTTALSVHFSGGEPSDATARAPRANPSVATPSLESTPEVEKPADVSVAGVVARGQVADEQGTAIANALVRIWIKNGIVPTEVRTDVGGAFSVALDTTREKCFVEARHADYATGRMTATLAEPIRLVLKRGTSVRVEVRAAGKPVAGATVAAPTPSDVFQLTTAGFRTAADATTDAAGVANLRVSPGTYSIWANSTAWAPKLSDPVVCVLGKEQTVRIELEAGGPVRGVVQASGVGPVAGARVVVQTRPGFRREARTDAEGRYVVEHVPLGSPYSVQVVADHPDYAAASSSRSWNAGDGNRMRFDLTLTVGARLHGVVLSADGRPLPHRRLVLSYMRGYFHVLYGTAFAGDTWPFAATSNGLGRFELRRLPVGEAALYLKGEWSVKTQVTLVAGKTHGPIELRLPLRQVVTGRVLNAAGEPLENARLSPGAGRTDAKGRFRIELDPKCESAVVVCAEGHVPFVQAVIPGADVEIRIPDAALAGIVIGPGGKGVADVEVSVMIAVRDIGHRSAGRTDEQGHFRLPGATQRKYEISVRAPGMVASGKQRVEGPRDGIEFVLATHAQAEQRRVRGVIVDADTGDPIDVDADTGAWVDRGILYGVHKGDGTVVRSWQLADRRAGSAGGFVCSVLAPVGAMKLVFAVRGYINSDPIDVTYDARTPIEPITVRMRRGGSIEVVVVEEDGTPVPGAAIWCNSGRGVFVRTDPQGRAVIKGIPPGPQALTASHPYLANMKAQTVDVTVTAQHRVEFRGKVAGKITIRLPKGTRPKTSFAISLSDAAGTVVQAVNLKGIYLDHVTRMFPDRWQYDVVVTQPGAYHLACTADGKALPARQVALQLRKTVNVDLKLDD